MSLELRENILKLLPSLGKGEEGAEVVNNIIGILEGRMWTGLDFPHQPHHHLRVMRDTQCIAAMQHLEKWEKALLEKGAVIHDLGRNFVENGLIEEEEHQNGSFVLAKVISSVWWKFPEDIADIFAEGVALHTKDVLPRSVARWIRVLRDSDRTSRLGMGGIIELAWYLGYRDSYISEIPAEKMADDELLFDLDIPITPEDIGKYDEKPRKYFNDNILPFLVENNRLPELAKRTRVLLDRVCGVPDFKRKNRKWKIEPVSPEAKFLSAPRIASMKSLLIEIGCY